MFLLYIYKTINHFDEIFIILSKNNKNIKFFYIKNYDLFLIYLN